MSNKSLTLTFYTILMISLGLVAAKDFAQFPAGTGLLTKISEIQAATRRLPVEERCDIFDFALRELLEEESSVKTRRQLFDEAIKYLEKYPLVLGEKRPALITLEECQERSSGKDLNGNVATSSAKSGLSKIVFNQPDTTRVSPRVKSMIERKLYEDAGQTQLNKTSEDPSSVKVSPTKTGWMRLKKRLPELLLKAYSLKNTIAPNEWVADLSRSHITNDLETLMDYEAFNPPKDVLLPSNQIVLAQGVGYVIVRTSIGHIRLNGVLYVPDMPHKIFSVSASVENYHTSLEFEDGKLLLVTESGRILAVAKRSDNIYKLERFRDIKKNNLGVSENSARNMNFISA